MTRIATISMTNNNPTGSLDNGNSTKAPGASESCTTEEEKALFEETKKFAEESASDTDSLQEFLDAQSIVRCYEQENDSLYGHNDDEYSHSRDSKYDYTSLLYNDLSTTTTTNATQVATDTNSSKLDLQSDQFQVIKYLKYIKTGSHTATVLSLCALNCYDFSAPYMQQELEGAETVKVLLNIIDSEHLNSRKAALRVLYKMAQYIPSMCETIFRYNAIESLCDIIINDNIRLRCYAANVLSIVCRNSKAKIQAIHRGALPSLLNMLIEIFNDYRSTRSEQNGGMFRDTTRTSIAESACKALETLCSALDCTNETESHKSSISLLKNETVIEVLRQILLLPIEYSSLIKPALQVVEKSCNIEASYKLKIATDELIENVLGFMASSQKEKDLQLVHRSAIFLNKFAREETFFKILLNNNIYSIMIEIIKESKNIELLSSVSDLLLTCMNVSFKFNMEIESLAINEILIPHVENMRSFHHPLLTNCVAILSLLAARQPEYRMQINKTGILPILVGFLNRTDTRLIKFSADLLYYLMFDSEASKSIAKLDGLRLLWSLMKNRNSAVVTSACRAIASSIRSNKSSASLVRSLVGGLELMVSLLNPQKNAEIFADYSLCKKSVAQTNNCQIEDHLIKSQKKLLGAVCEAICSIADDEQSLAVITDHGAIRLISNLTITRDPKLRQQLSLAIASCCQWSQNQIAFGQMGVIERLVIFTRTSQSRKVLTAATLALNNLSRQTSNCHILFKCGALTSLINIIESGHDEEKNAAECIKHIRIFAEN
ncbi:MAG: hypothetical protein MHMPM18_000449 [Marteilia pararefringens]